MLLYNRIGLGEEIDVAKRNNIFNSKNGFKS